MFFPTNPTSFGVMVCFTRKQTLNFQNLDFIAQINRIGGPITTP